MQKGLTNIVFDFGGVLMQHDRQGCLQALRQIMADEDIRNVLGFANDLPNTLRHQFELGLCSPQVFLNQVLAHSQRGTTGQQVMDAWNTIHAGILDSTWEQLELLHDKGFRLFLMSNTDDIHWQHTMLLYREKIECLFDKVFLSFEEGLAKPDEMFFKKVNRWINTEQTWFVDDMEINRLTAEKCVGWHTCASIDELMHCIFNHKEL